MSSIDENATVFESCPSDNISSRSNSESQTNTVFGRMTARAGLNVPTLNTMSIVGQNDVSSNNNTYIRSSYFTIPPGLSPTTLLQSPVFLSSPLAQQSPTTGKFQFTPGGNDTNSNSNSENVDSAFFSFRPATESSYSSFIGTSSKINAVHESSVFSSRTEKECPQMLHSQTQASPYFPIDINRGSNVKVVDISGGKNLPPLDVEISDQIGGGDATYVDASEDGYNWRKYGKKQVKGSDYPRSYYKCTHLSCTVKKKVERSYEGHITEIIYKGAHNHSKPHPNKGLAFGLIDPRSGNNVQTGVTFDGSLGFSNDDDDDEDVSDLKIRKMEEYVSETSGATRAVKKPKVVVQTMSQVDILDDGYHWRKYGQKVVKGNPNPRSYYKCTSPGCIVRKHVERASHDLNSVITMYEGKHNHDVPAARNSGYSNLGNSDNRVAQIGNTAHLQRPEQSQVQNVFRSNRPTDMSSLGFGYGVNEAGLASLVMARLDYDYEAPIQPQFGHASEMRFLLPKGEPNLESTSESCSMNIPNSSSVYSHVTRNYE